MLPLPPRRPLLLALLISILTILVIILLSGCSTSRLSTRHLTTIDSLRTEQRTDTLHLTLSQSDLTTLTQTTHTRDSIVIEEWFYPYSASTPTSFPPSQSSSPLSPFHQGDSVAAIPTNYRRTTAILQSEINLTRQRELNRRLDSLVTAHAALLSHTRAIEDSLATATTTGTAALTPIQLVISRYSNLAIILLVILLIAYCIYFFVNRLK